MNKHEDTVIEILDAWAEYYGDTFVDLDDVELTDIEVEDYVK